MNYIDILGFIGVAMILLAYFLLTSNKLKAHDIQYIILNLTGAVLAFTASLLMAYYPFVVLEGTWAIVSLIALFKYLNTRQNDAS